MTSTGTSGLPSDDVLAAIRSHICARPYEVEPGRFIRCQSRRTAVCPSCAGLYRGDWQRIARSGIYDADGHPLLSYKYFFITLSAPSFGSVHLVPKWERDAGRRCKCGQTHGHDDVHLRGLPIDQDSYRYEDQVRWHGALGRLWKSAAAAMRRLCPDAEYYAVRELQSRMALHVHAVVRVPAWTAVDAEAMGHAARMATATHPETGEVVEWGKRGVQDREIRARITESDDVTPDMSRAAARIVSYVSKCLAYSTKDITPGERDETATHERVEFVKRMRQAARIGVRCVDCPPGGPSDCPRRAHDNLGYGGHVVTVSRPTEQREGWSLSHLTRKRLREERAAWMEANRPADVGGGLSDGDVRLAEWLAEQAARRAREAWSTRQHARAP